MIRLCYYVSGDADPESDRDDSSGHATTIYLDIVIDLDPMIVVVNHVGCRDLDLCPTIGAENDALRSGDDGLENADDGVRSDLANVGDNVLVTYVDS